MKSSAAGGLGDARLGSGQRDADRGGQLGGYFGVVVDEGRMSEDGAQPGKDSDDLVCGR